MSSERFQIAPMRSVGDFVLDSRRYLPPTFNDLKRFNNRVVSNLLYYQTNYFAISSFVFIIFTLFQFNRVLIGLFGFATGVVVCLFTFDRLPQLRQLRSQYPMSILGAWAFEALITYLTFRPLLNLALIVLVPITFWILHASMRSRGIKNKLSNKMEQLGAPVYKNTPMEQILTAFGVEARDLEE